MTEKLEWGDSAVETIMQKHMQLFYRVGVTAAYRAVTQEWADVFAQMDAINGKIEGDAMLANVRSEEWLIPIIRRPGTYGETDITIGKIDSTTGVIVPGSTQHVAWSDEGRLHTWPQFEGIDISVLTDALLELDDYGLKARTASGL